MDDDQLAKLSSLLLLVIAVLILLYVVLITGKQLFQFVLSHL